MQVHSSAIQIARVLSESDDSIIIEVVKDKNATIQLDENKEENRFFTLLFVHNTAETGQPPTMEVWIPWDAT